MTGEPCDVCGRPTPHLAHASTGDSQRPSRMTFERTLADEKKCQSVNCATRSPGSVLLGQVPSWQVKKAVVPSRFFSPTLSARAQAKAEAVRCRMGQCQNDASGATVGVVATYRGRDKVYPVCKACLTLVLITGTRTAPYDPRGNSVLRGADNDVLMVGGRRVTRRAKA